MKVYCTTKNSGPSWASDPLFMVYLGISLEEAVITASTFHRYEKGERDFPKRFPEIYSALPNAINWEMIRFYTADGWWYSIVVFELGESFPKRCTCGAGGLIEPDCICSDVVIET